MHLPVPSLLAEATVEKGLAKVEVETGKLNAAQENLAALESAATAADGADGAAADAGGGDALEEARAAAEAAMHEADEAKQSKSEELKAVQAEHKEATQAKAAVQKQTMLPAKKAKTKADQAAKMAARNKADDADALATAAAEAADVFAAAEAELAAALAGELAAKALVVPVQTEAKALDLAAKEAKKVFMAAKKEAASNATVHKQSDAKLKQAHSKVTAAEGAVARAEKALEKPRATLERSAEKVAEKTAALGAVEAHKAANEKAIADAIARIAAICSEGRPAEIAKIVAQHQASLDQLIADLEPLLANVAAIEKLRADRVAAHGQAEVDRRSGLQHKIHCLKKAENDRRDAVDRTCVLCKCVFHGRAAASAHATPIGQGGQQCPMLVAYFLNPHGGAPKVRTQIKKKQKTFRSYTYEKEQKKRRRRRRRRRRRGGRKSSFFKCKKAQYYWRAALLSPHMCAEATAMWSASIISGDAFYADVCIRVDVLQGHIHHPGTCRPRHDHPAAHGRFVLGFRVRKAALR